MLSRSRSRSGSRLDGWMDGWDVCLLIHFRFRVVRGTGRRSSRFKTSGTGMVVGVVTVTVTVTVTHHRPSTTLMHTPD
jgi:hypothetical protein